MGLALEIKNKTLELECDGDTIFYFFFLCSRYSHQRIGTGNGGITNKRTSRDRPNYSFITNGQNTEKRPGELRRFVITQTPVRSKQLTLVWKTLNKVKIIRIIISRIMFFMYSNSEIICNGLYSFMQTRNLHTSTHLQIFQAIIRFQVIFLNYYTFKCLLLIQTI